jgi:hypothetical protein
VIEANLHVVVPDVELHLVFLARKQERESVLVVVLRQVWVQQRPVLPPHRLKDCVHSGKLGETLAKKIIQFRNLTTICQIAYPLDNQQICQVDWSQLNQVHKSPIPKKLHYLCWAIFPELVLEDSGRVFWTPWWTSRCRCHSFQVLGLKEEKR